MFLIWSEKYNHIGLAIITLRIKTLVFLFKCLKMKKLDENAKNYCIKEKIEYTDIKTESLCIKTRILANSDKICDLIKTWDNVDGNNKRINVILIKTDTDEVKFLN